MNSLYWIIAIVVLQGVIGAIAKKAQEKNQAARPGAQPPAPATGTSAAPVPPRPPAPAGASIRASVQTPVEIRPPLVQAPPAPPRPRVIARGGTAKPVAAGPARGVVRQSNQAKPANPRGAVTGNRGAIRAQRPPQPPVVPTAPRESEEAAAMRSRALVRESVEKVRAIEHRVAAPHVGAARNASAGAGASLVAGIRAGFGAAGGQRHSAGGVDANAIRDTFRNPKRLREAFVVAEVLRRPSL